MKSIVMREESIYYGWGTFGSTLGCIGFKNGIKCLGLVKDVSDEVDMEVSPKTQSWASLNSWEDESYLVL